MTKLIHPSPIENTSDRARGSNCHEKNSHSDKQDIDFIHISLFFHSLLIYSLVIIYFYLFLLILLCCCQ